MSEYAVPVDEAMDRLAVIPDYDQGDGPEPCVHTFVDSRIGLLGAHWSLDMVRAAFDRWGVEEAGDSAKAMKHGLVVTELSPYKRAVFFETKAAEDV